MLDLCNFSTQSPSDPHPFESLLNEPVSFDPNEFWDYEHRLCRLAAGVADTIMFKKMIKLHEDNAKNFIKGCGTF